MITHNNQYIAKESLTFPLLVTVMFGMSLYASIYTPKFWCIFGAVFFGLGVAVYAYKYIRYGRTTLIIDSEAITVKDWGKTQIFYWIYIVSVYTELRIAYVGLWDQQWLSIKTSVNGEQYEFQDISYLTCIAEAKVFVRLLKNMPDILVLIMRLLVNHAITLRRYCWLLWLQLS